MPQGPTRGIEPRTPTAGCCRGGPPSGGKRTAPMPGHATPRAAGASYGRAGSPEKAATTAARRKAKEALETLIIFLRYFMTSTTFPLEPCFSAYVWIPSTRHARDAKSSGAVAAIASCVYTQHTHEAQVTRPFTDGHVELCDMMATGVKKAGRLPAFELGVAYQIVNPGSSTLLSATLRHLEISGLRARQNKPEMSRTPAQRALSDRGG